LIVTIEAEKIWYFKNVQFLLGHPIYVCDVETAANLARMKEIS